MSAHQCMIWMKYFFRRGYITGTNQTETVPTGAKEVEIRIQGGGGGGTGSSEFLYGGSGGGGGYMKVRITPVTPGQTFTYTVGAKGLGGDPLNSPPATAGGLSNVVFQGITYIAYGGEEGQLDQSTNPGGAGGSTTYTTGGAANVTLQLDGDTGADGFSFGPGGSPGSALTTPTEQVSINGFGGAGGEIGGTTPGSDGNAGFVVFIYT